MPHASATILLVDDSEICRTVATSILEDSGHRVVALESPLGIGQALADELPDLVLVDVDMPSMPGDRVVELILCYDPRCRAVFYSDRPEGELRRLALASGAVGFIPKGVPPQELVRRVGGFISGAGPDELEGSMRRGDAPVAVPHRSSIPAPA
jgi:two-component system chemotaxis response regulator CheY